MGDFKDNNLGYRGLATVKSPEAGGIKQRSVLVKIDLTNILPTGICIKFDLKYLKNAMRLSSA